MARTVDLLLFDQFSNHCLANCVEPLRAANDLTGEVLFKWRYLTLDGQGVQSSSGLPVQPEGRLGDAVDGDILYIISSYQHQKLDTRATRDALNAAARGRDLVIGFDTGSWLMASAGLLDNRAATIHWTIFDAFSERFLNVDAKRERYILTASRGSCGGAMAAFDLSLDLIGQMHGTALKLDVAAMLMHDLTPKDDAQSGRSLVIKDALVRACVGQMRSALEHPQTIAMLADQLHCHPKKMQRRFLADLGAPPAQIYKYIRLSAARDMITNGDLNIAEIAVRTGYQNASSLTRAFKARFGVTPMAFRKG